MVQPLQKIGINIKTLKVVKKSRFKPNCRRVSVCGAFWLKHVGSSFGGATGGG